MLDEDIGNVHLPHANSMTVSQDELETAEKLLVLSNSVLNETYYLLASVVKRF